MTIKLTYPVPTSPYFTIILPKQYYDEARIDRPDPCTVELTDLNTKNLIKVELEAIWSMTEKEFITASAFCLLTTGQYPHQLKPTLVQKYPQLGKKFEIEYWLLKRL